VNNETLYIGKESQLIAILDWPRLKPGRQSDRSWPWGACYSSWSHWTIGRIFALHRSTWPSCGNSRSPRTAATC
jgi:hypothetical protein